MRLALGITTVLCVLISFGVFARRVDEVVATDETAIARAAGSALGQAGFAVMVVAAPLAHVAVGEHPHLHAAGSTAKLAETDTFPPMFRQRVRVGGGSPGSRQR